MTKFYNIANKLDSNYNFNECVIISDDDLDKKIINYLKNESEIKTGDIVFVGSTYETRQHYGFIIVDKRDSIKYYSAEQCIDLVYSNEDFMNYLSSNNFKYKELFKGLNNNFSELSGYKYEPDEVAENYSKINLW